MTDNVRWQRRTNERNWRVAGSTSASRASPRDGGEGIGPVPVTSSIGG